MSEGSANSSFSNKLTFYLLFNFYSISIFVFNISSCSLKYCYFQSFACTTRFLLTLFSLSISEESKTKLSKSSLYLFISSISFYTSVFSIFIFTASSANLVVKSLILNSSFSFYFYSS